MECWSQLTIDCGLNLKHRLPALTVVKLSTVNKIDNVFDV